MKRVLLTLLVFLIAGVLSSCVKTQPSVPEFGKVSVNINWPGVSAQATTLSDVLLTVTRDSYSNGVVIPKGQDSATINVPVGDNYSIYVFSVGYAGVVNSEAIILKYKVIKNVRVEGGKTTEVSAVLQDPGIKVTPIVAGPYYAGDKMGVTYTVLSAFDATRVGLCETPIESLTQILGCTETSIPGLSDILTLPNVTSPTTYYLQIASCIYNEDLLPSAFENSPCDISPPTEVVVSPRTSGTGSISVTITP